MASSLSRSVSLPVDITSGDERPFSKRQKMAPRMSPERCSCRARKEDVGKDRKVYFQFDHLDIFREILFRLPIEALLRSQCVCKTWYNIIKDPAFISMHMNISSKQPPRFICQYVHVKETIQDYSSSSKNRLLLWDTQDGKTRKMPIEEKLHQFRRIIFSRNGLLCIATSSYSRRDSVVICNPITKERIQLPQIDYVKRGFCSVKRLISPRVGFCFVPERRKHIVVQALYSNMDRYEEPIKFYILTSEQRSWRLLTSPPSINRKYILGDTIYWNKAFHWRLTRICGVCGPECILSFDTIHETFQIISFPDAHQGLCINLLVLNGLLSLIEKLEENIKVWEVTGDKVGEFFLACRETCDIGTNQFSLVSRLPKNENLLLSDYEGRLHTGFFVASNDMKQYTALKIDGLPSYFYASFYNPSLVSVRSMGFV